MDTSDKIKKIILEIAEKKTSDAETSMTYDDSSGYTVPYDSYSHHIGLELMKENISFETRFDKGMGREYLNIKKINKSEQSFGKIYLKQCQETPSDEFIADKLTIDEQRSFLLRVWNKMDFMTSLSTQSFTNMSSIMQVLKSFKNVGIDHTYINPEINMVFKDCYQEMNRTKLDMLRPNTCLIFLHGGFYFDDELMQMHKNHFEPDDYNNFLKFNGENKSNYAAKILDHTLESKAHIKSSRSKI